MKNTLKQALQEQMKSVSLDDRQLENLMQMQKEPIREDNKKVKEQRGQDVVNTTSRRDTARLRFMQWSVAIAAVFAVASLSFILVSNFSNTTAPSLSTPSTLQGASSEMVQKIADEVATNHLKMKPMEIQTAAIGEVRNYFTELDFMPQLSQHVEGIGNSQLAGGRYCSIQGSTAAQLRYKDKKGDYVTLFETHYSPELFKQLPDVDKGQKPIVTFARGIKVTIWVEKGLLMVSTEKPSS